MTVRRRTSCRVVSALPETAVVLVIACSAHAQTATGSQTAVNPAAQLATTTADKPASASNQLETIVVTSRKRAEALQDVPLSVTAISKAVLQAARVQNVRDLAFLTPGVTVQDYGAESGTAITVRGVTDNSSGTGIADVATFLDGVYLRDVNAINLEGASLERVEVIKGPVSATYGRDAYAGVLNYVTQRPTNTKHADISYSVGDHGRNILSASVSGALIKDRVMGKIFGTYDTFDGTDRDEISGVNAGGYEKKDVGGLLDIHWNDNITTRLDAYYGYDTFDQSDAVALPPNCGFNKSIAANQLYCGRISLAGTGVQYSNVPQAGGTGNTRQTYFGSMRNTFTYDFGKIDLVTGATKINESRFAAFDLSRTGLLYPLTNGTSVPEHEFFGFASRTGNFSQEARYSSPQNRRIRFGFGGYFFRETRQTTTAAGLSSIGIPAGVRFANPLLYTWATPYGQIGRNYNLANQLTTESAGFANIEFDILKHLTFESDYRFTDIMQQFDQVKNQYTTKLYPYGPHLSQTNQYFNTNNSLRWQIQRNIMAYVSAANGTRPGGFNGASTVPADISYAPEKNWSYEAGIKTTLLDQRLQLNAAVYHIDTSNVQIYGPSSDPHNTGLVLKNYGSTTNTGFEIDAAAKPVRSTTLGLGVSYTDPRFTNNSLDVIDVSNCASIPSCAINLRRINGRRSLPIDQYDVPYASKVTLSMSVQLDYDLPWRSHWFGRADYRLESPQYTDPTNVTSIGFRNLLNLNTGVSRGPYALSFWIRNVTDDRTPVYFSNNVELNHFQDVPVAVLPDGRTFGATLAAHF